MGPLVELTLDNGHYISVIKKKHRGMNELPLCFFCCFISSLFTAFSLHFLDLDPFDLRDADLRNCKGLAGT